MSITRRQMSAILPAAFLLKAFAADDVGLQSATYPFDKLEVKTTKVSQIRDILQGKTATGETIEVHETVLSPGGMPHPPHHHVHSEMFLLREGNIEVTINGKSYPLSGGSVAFIGSNDEHGIKNVGATPATYFVIAIGPSAQRLTK
jgi:mannose-6-phosphate isomerase-like protein (cupin superfamily)